MFWFYYRNHMKCTYENRETFTNAYGAIPLTYTSSQLLSQLELIREQIITIMMDNDPDSNKDKRLDEFLNKYLAIFRGFVYLPTEQNIYGIGTSRSTPYELQEQVGLSPLRHLFCFKWDDSVSGVKLLVNDTLFEMMSMLTNYGIWLMNWCENVSLIMPMNYFPQHISVMQKILRRSAGLFHIVYQVFQPQLPLVLQTKFDLNVLQTYYFQCFAEAWELQFIKVLQDIVHKQDDWELNPYGGPVNPRYVSQLALLIYDNFNQALTQIRTAILTLGTNNNDSGGGSNCYDQWSNYLELKSYYYLTWYLLSNAYDRWLSASDVQQVRLQIIKELNEIDKQFVIIDELCNKYNVHVKKPENHINKTSLLVELTLYAQMFKEQLHTSQRPNGIELIFEKLPLINLKDMNPIIYKFPPFDEIWNSNIYNEFCVQLPKEEANALAAQIKKQQLEIERQKLDKKSSPFKTLVRWIKRAKSPKDQQTLEHSLLKKTYVNIKSSLPLISSKKTPIGHQITRIPVLDNSEKIPLLVPLILPIKSIVPSFPSPITQKNSTSKLQKVKELRKKDEVKSPPTKTLQSNQLYAKLTNSAKTKTTTWDQFKYELKYKINDNVTYKKLPSSAKFSLKKILKLSNSPPFKQNPDKTVEIEKLHSTNKKF